MENYNIETSKFLERVERLEGWCIRDKSSELIKHVILTKPQVAVEVGIYGGRSLFPVAYALREIGEGGKIWGIEAWSNSVAVEEATGEVNDKWWSELDFTRIKRDFLKFIVDEELVNQVGILETSSERAALLFSSIDFLHIDGSHAEGVAFNDVKTFLPLLKEGGILFMDDINWPSTLNAVNLIKEYCITVEEFSVGDNSWGVYRKRGDE